MVETPRRRHIAEAVEKPHAWFADKALLEFIENAKILEEPIAERQKRFSNVLTRKLGFLQ
jgi:hypothetical protein